jgi:shikimate kinase
VSKSSVFLIGMMGAGKSTVGRCLAKTLKYKFLDTDQLIEEQEKRTIESIFKENGESYFRNIERDIINQFNNKTSVYSTGGGLPIYNKNIHKLKDIGQVIYLKTSIGELLNNRINNNTSRPLFQDSISFENLLKQREPIYCEADFVVTTDSKSPEEIAIEISFLLSNSLKFE